MTTTNKTTTITNPTINNAADFYGVTIKNIKLSEIRDSETNLQGLFFLRAKSEIETIEKRLKSISTSLGKVESGSLEEKNLLAEQETKTARKEKCSAIMDSMKSIGIGGEKVNPEVLPTVAVWVYAMYGGSLYNCQNDYTAEIEKQAELLQGYCNKHANFVAKAAASKSAKVDKTFYCNVKTELDSMFGKLLPGRNFHANTQDVLAFFSNIVKFTCKPDENGNISEKSGISARKKAATMRVCAQLACFKLENRELKYSGTDKKSAK